MKIELKNVSIAFLHDIKSHIFTASLYMDGEKAADMTLHNCFSAVDSGRTGAVKLDYVDLAFRETLYSHIMSLPKRWNTISHGEILGQGEIPKRLLIGLFIGRMVEEQIEAVSSLQDDGYPVVARYRLADGSEDWVGCERAEGAEFDVKTWAERQGQAVAEWEIVYDGTQHGGQERKGIVIERKVKNSVGEILDYEGLSHFSFCVMEELHSAGFPVVAEYTLGNGDMAWVGCGSVEEAESVVKGWAGKPGYGLGEILAGWEIASNRSPKPAPGEAPGPKPGM